MIVPFTILIDSAEQHPWSFCGFTQPDGEPIEVRTQWASLGRHPNGLGDYSIDGHVGQVAIERKSREDAQSTLLGWCGRRDRFEQELSNLSKVKCSCVIVEATLHDTISLIDNYGTKTVETQQRIMFRSIIAYMQDYRVPWLFCDSRRMAEAAAFRFLQRYWKKHGASNDCQRDVGS